MMNSEIEKKNCAGGNTFIHFKGIMHKHIHTHSPMGNLIPPINLMLCYWEVE